MPPALPAYLAGCVHISFQDANLFALGKLIHSLVENVNDVKEMGPKCRVA